MENIVPLVEIFITIFYLKKLSSGRSLLGWSKFELFESNLSLFKFDIGSNQIAATQYCAAGPTCRRPLPCFFPNRTPSVPVLRCSRCPASTRLHRLRVLVPPPPILLCRVPRPTPGPCSSLICATSLSAC
jgi:hypothetical protein